MNNTRNYAQLRYFDLNINCPCSHCHLNLFNTKISKMSIWVKWRIHIHITYMQVRYTLVAIWYIYTFQATLPRFFCIVFKPGHGSTVYVTLICHKPKQRETAVCSVFLSYAPVSPVLFIHKCKSKSIHCVIYLSTYSTMSNSCSMCADCAWRCELCAVHPYK